MRRYRPPQARRSGPVTISLYLKLSRRPSTEWLRAFRGELNEVQVAIPPTFSLYQGGHFLRDGYRAGSGRTGVRRWLRRLTRHLLPRRQMRLVVGQCAPDQASVRAAVLEARAVLQALDNALLEAELRGSDEMRMHEEQLEQLLRTLRASDPLDDSKPPLGGPGGEIFSGGHTAG